MDDRRRRWLLELRRSILSDEGEFQERIHAIQQEALRIHAEMEEQIEKLTAPANRIGDSAWIAQGGYRPCYRRWIRILC